MYLALGTIAYASIWSYIGILKILSLNAYVFDLGISAEKGWKILHTNLGIHGYLLGFLNSGIVFPLSPLTGSGNFFAMIIFQAVAISSVGPALYLIAREKGLGQNVSLMMAFVLFLYFPVYGIMWFDFHYQAFFLPLFVFGYLLYIRRSYFWSTVLFALSGMVRYPYSIFPLGFAIIELALILRQKSSNRDIRRMKSMLLLALIMGTFTVLGYLFLGVSNTIPHGTISAYTTTSQTIWLRLLVILLFLAPLLFLPIMSVRWIIFTIPSFFLILTTSYTWYLYPHIFEGQYVAGIASFILLAFVDSIRRINERKKRSEDLPNLLTRKRKFLRPAALVATAIVVLFVMNTVLAPFSPLNQQYGDGFNYTSNTDYSPAVYSELNSMVKMIPASDPYVVYQNNIPELLPRQLPFNGSILMGGYLGSFTAVSAEQALNNSWKVSLGDKFVYLPVDYAIADANSADFYLQNNSMYKIVQDMYFSGRYGIVSEGYGLLLMERGYAGSIKDYVPESVTIPGDAFVNNATSLSTVNVLSGITSSGNVFTYSGTFSYMFPGNYNLTLYLNPPGEINSSTGSIHLAVYSGNTTIASYRLNLTGGGSNPSPGKFELSLDVNQICGNLWFSIGMPNAGTSLNIVKLTVVQETPHV